MLLRASVADAGSAKNEGTRFVMKKGVMDVTAAYWNMGFIGCHHIDLKVRKGRAREEEFGQGSHVVL